MEDKIYIYYRESAFQSILSDIVSFACLIFFLYVNKYYLGDHVSLGILLFIMWCLILVGRGMKKSKTLNGKKELREFLEKELDGK